MLRGSCTLLVVLAAAVTAAGDDDAKVKAKAALTLRAAVGPAATGAAPGLAVKMGREEDDCDGTCCDDLGKKLALAKRGESPKPVLVYVGCTPTTETLKALAGYVHCRVREYDRDGKGREPRVLLNLAKGGEFYRVAEFKPAATAAEVKAEAAKGVPKP